MLDYPHNLDSERCVIGSMIMGAADERLIPAFFYHELYAKLFVVVDGMRRDGIGTDAAAVRHHAAKSGTTVPSVELINIMATVTDTEWIGTHVDILIECWRRRRMVKLSEWLYQQSKDWTADVDKTWETVGREVGRQMKFKPEGE